MNRRLHLLQFRHDTLKISAAVPPAPVMQTRTALLRPFAFIGIAYGALATIADPDLWGHLRFGLDTLASGHIGFVEDPYSFTSDRPWVNHEWVSELSTALAYAVGGVPGLMLLKACLVSVMAALVWYALRGTRFGWRWLGVALVSWATLPLAFTLRPQLWTGIALVVFCWVLSANSRALLWLLPPLFAIWANLHGGWIVAGGLLAVWTVVAFIQRHELRWALLTAGVASLLATLLTPFGVHLWTFVLETVRFNRDDITEWRPIWQRGAGFITLWSLILGTIVLSIRRNGRPSLKTVVVLTVFAVASARVTRLVPLFAITAVMLLSRQWPRELSRANGGLARVALDGFAVAAVVVASISFRAIPSCISTTYPLAPDTAAAEALRGANGRLVPAFAWGEYAIWHFGPALQVSFDGRRETVYSDGTMREQRAIADGTEEGFRVLERLRPNYVWLKAESAATAEWLRGHGYREDVRTDRSYIAVRADLPRLSPWAGTPSGCFPGP
jgi:hypothetical protein